MASAATSARDAWIASVVDDEERRRQLRETAYCLQDFKQARLESLEHTLDLRSWPPLARMRFIDAWQRLKDGSAVDPVTAVVPALAPETPFEAARRAGPPANLGWMKTADPLSGNVFFYNTMTGATSLTWPPRT